MSDHHYAGTMAMTVRRGSCIIVVFLLTCPWAASSSAAALPTRPRVLLALGDSAAAPKGSYVDKLFRKLRAPGRWQVDRLIKVAVPGETSESILGGQLTAAVRAIRQRRSDIRVVTVDIGANDGLRGLHCELGSNAPPCGIPGVDDGRACLHEPAVRPCSIRPNLDRLLGALRRALRSDSGSEAIALMGLPNPWSGTNSPAEQVVDRGLLGDDARVACVPPARQGLDDLLACASARHSARLADLYPVFAGHGPQLTNITTGDYHFSDAGHEAAARVFLRALRPTRLRRRSSLGTPLQITRGRADATRTFPRMMRPGRERSGVPVGLRSRPHRACGKAPLSPVRSRGMLATPGLRHPAPGHRKGPSRWHPNPLVARGSRRSAQRCTGTLPCAFIARVSWHG